MGPRHSYRHVSLATAASKEPRQSKGGGCSPSIGRASDAIERRGLESDTHRPTTAATISTTCESSDRVSDRALSTLAAWRFATAPWMIWSSTRVLPPAPCVVRAPGKI